MEPFFFFNFLDFYGRFFFHYVFVSFKYTFENALFSWVARICLMSLARFSCVFDLYKSHFVTENQGSQPEHVNSLPVLCLKGSCQVSKKQERSCASNTICLLWLLLFSNSLIGCVSRRTCESHRPLHLSLCACPPFWKLDLERTSHMHAPKNEGPDKGCCKRRIYTSL